jgi:hypothetical protein
METDYQKMNGLARRCTARLSVNETLARGMTSRFFEEMRERCLTKLLGQRPPTVLKRAAAYRAQCRWFEQRTPNDLIIATHPCGPQDGKTKDAYRVYLSWDMGLDLHRMMAVASIIDARKIDVLDCPVAIVTEHAIHRLFQRLNTLDYRAVLAELNPAIEIFFPLATEMLRMSCPTFMAPTPHGVLVFRLALPDEEAAPVVAVTWVSDQRMIESGAAKLSAVRRARAEQGLVLPHGRGYRVITVADETEE